MENKKSINLFEKMQEIVDEYMKFYKTDFEYDKNILLDKNFNTNTFYWIVRESGTHMIHPGRMLFKEDWGYAEVNYWTPQAIEIYKIDVVKRGKKYVYGTITKIKKEELLSLIKNPKEFDSAEILAIGEEGRFEDEIKGQTCTELFYNMLDKFKITKRENFNYYIINYNERKKA